MRKKGLLLIAVCMMAAGALVGCGAGSQAEAAVQETQLAAGTETTIEGSAAGTDQSSTEETDTTAAKTDGEDTPVEGGRTLVVYYSASGNTERVAEVIAETTGGELFELEPVEPYTSEDLDWTDDNSRVTVEHLPHMVGGSRMAG